MPPSSEPKHSFATVNDDNEERKGLLSDTSLQEDSVTADYNRLELDYDNDTMLKSSGWLAVDANSTLSRRAKCLLWAFASIMLVIAAVSMGCVSGFFNGLTFGFGAKDTTSCSRGALHSNGTHDFKRTVLLVSIDGLRADYLDRGLTPHLLDISKKGLRAKSMRPIFPTLTFPNHWALMTGLYAESHGIVANNFWDPQLKEEFHYNRVESCWNPAWWFGEPMWETAEKAHITTANLMWPGPPKTSTNASSTYFVPWRDKVPLGEKLDQILTWIDLPLAERPQLILAYEPSLDQAGHATGPYSKRVNETLVAVDTFARDLHLELESRNLTDIVDVIFVSDHGMTDTSHPTYIYMDDIIGADGIKAIEHEDGWPAMGLRFDSVDNHNKYLELLLSASKATTYIDETGVEQRKFDVYTHETMPERYHFSHHERIAPIYVIPRMGYVLTTRAEGDVGMSKGNHGYDNIYPSMHAIFVAHGPFSYDVKAQHQQRDALSRRSPVKNPNAGWHSTSAETGYVMETFQNVEIYNLVMKLLGVSSHKTAPNNGTIGFWDRYL